MKLTKEQQDLLKKASTGLKGDDYAKLSVEASNAQADKINEVIKQLHEDNPTAFLGVYNASTKRYTYSLHELSERNFFHEPRVPEPEEKIAQPPFKSVVKKYLVVRKSTLNK